VKAAAAVVALVLGLAGCGGDSDSAAPAPAWNHDPADSSRGPAAWGEIDTEFDQCATGDAQSPVDLTGAAPADLPDLGFDYPETSLTVKNTGHVIEAELPEDSDLTLSVGGDEYRLAQFHLHAPSEHTVDGEAYAAEAHLVHESEDGELAVVAVLIHRTGGQPFGLVGAVVESAPDVAGEEVELADEWSPLELPLRSEEPIPVSPPHFTYPGSLTTPGCDEGVRWLVIQGVYPTERSTIDRLHELIAGFPEYDGYESNNRPAQPLNGRVLENDTR
jgi:carbonic anhydrase